jgi:diguanylate cyclase (GGDEF)-like protein
MNAESNPTGSAAGTILASAPQAQGHPGPPAGQTLADVIRGAAPDQAPPTSQIVGPGADDLGPRRALRRRPLPEQGPRRRPGNRIIGLRLGLGTIGRRAVSRGAAARWNATPTHLALARRIEPGLAAALALTATLATPAAARLLGGGLLGVPLDPASAASGADLVRTWFPAAIGLLVAALSVAGLFTVGWLILRGGVLLATAAAMASLTPASAPVALVWILAVAASYPFLLPRTAGRALVTASMAATATPLLVQAARTGAADPAGSLLGSSGGAPGFTTLTLLGAMAVVASLGSAAAATRSTLRATAHLAIRRTRDAEQAGAALDRVSTQDELTGLPNRATLTREAILALAQADVTGGQIGLLMISLSRSGTLREGLGAEADDEVVRQIGRRLRAARPATEVVARTGEHRFTVLIPGIGPEGGTSAARRLAALIEEPVATSERTVAVSGAIGIAVSGPGLDTADELIRSAEEAMRSAERGGRTPWAMFDRAMRAHGESQAALEVQLRDAILNGTIDAAFQVITPAALKDGLPDRPIAVEALARWTRPDGTTVSPQRFLPMTEELGLGGQLGLLVLDRALDAYQGWLANGATGLQICVNVSSAQLLDPEFAHQVSARLGSRGIPAGALILEVSAAGYRDGEQARSSLGMLRSLGVGIALDDFGRDGTSLATLRQLPLTMVKLDHRLSLDLGRNDVVIRAVVGMCRELGLQTVAEGIETRLQLEAAERTGLDAVQGFLIGIPTRAQDALTGLMPR